jgi:regulator of cell morphogenesis and NO signaling
MNRFQTEQSVSSVVEQLPQAAAVFERLGIDFCCGGRIPLAQACTRLGLETDVVLQELQHVAQGRAEGFDAARASTLEVLDRIVHVHHSFVKAELPRLTALMEKVDRVHGALHPDTIPEMARIWRRLAMEFDMHLRKEEEILFPALRELALGRQPQLHCGVEAPMRVMELEHDEAGELLKRLRSLAGGYVAPAEACGSWRALWGGLDEFERDLHLHVHLENNVLFPRVREQLQGASCRAP